MRREIRSTKSETPVKKAAILAGFGGPRSLAEVKPFLRSVLEGVTIPEKRLDEVTRRYEMFHGVSPYNPIAEKQKKALEEWFAEKKIAVSVHLAYRHSNPSFKDLFITLKKRGIREAVVFVLSPFRSVPSFGKYRKKLDQANQETGAGVSLTYTAPFFDHPLFIDAQSERLRRELESIPRNERTLTYFLFSAHSIPTKTAGESRYADEFAETAALIAKRLNLEHWSLGYQSRSGDPAEPWLEPSLAQSFRILKAQGFRRVVVIPLGFLCENMELLYDLDVEAKAEAEKIGLCFSRCPAVNDEPSFVEMMGRLVSRELGLS